MEFDLDKHQKGKIFFLLMFQTYKIVMGSLLLLFVPQSCDDDICTAGEIITKGELYYKVGIFLNFSTLLSFLYLYITELQRENWFINYLDSNEDFEMNTLDAFLCETENEVIDIYNASYLRSVIWANYFNAANILLSSIIIFAHYGEASTLTSLISFVLLIVTKLHNSYNIAKESHVEKKALSAYMTDAVVFNVLDLTNCAKTMLPISFQYHPI